MMIKVYIAMVYFHLKEGDIHVSPTPGSDKRFRIAPNEIAFGLSLAHEKIKQRLEQTELSVFRLLAHPVWAS